jgi:quercetin dioxygenase-like cupin family protein
MMSVKPLAKPAHRRPNSQAMGASHVEFDIGTELESLQREPEWLTGHNSKTLVKYDSLRIVLIAMKARTRIPEHQTEGRISIHTIRGHIQVRATGRTFDLPSGGLLALDQSLRHDVEALEDSAFLLSIAWPGANAK